MTHKRRQVGLLTVAGMCLLALAGSPSPQNTGNASDPPTVEELVILNAAGVEVIHDISYSARVKVEKFSGGEPTSEVEYQMRYMESGLFWFMERQGEDPALGEIGAGNLVDGERLSSRSLMNGDGLYRWITETTNPMLIRRSDEGKLPTQYTNVQASMKSPDMLHFGFGTGYSLLTQAFQASKAQADVTWSIEEQPDHGPLNITMVRGNEPVATFEIAPEKAYLILAAKIFHNGQLYRRYQVISTESVESFYYPAAVIYEKFENGILGERVRFAFSDIAINEGIDPQRFTWEAMGFPEGTRLGVVAADGSTDLLAVYEGELIPYEVFEDIDIASGGAIRENLRDAVAPPTSRATPP